MSVTYLDLLRELNAAVEAAGARLLMRADVPTQRRSLKADAGAGAHTTVFQPELKFAQTGGKTEHGNSLTTGTVAFVLAPSNATDDVTIEAASLLMETGNQIIMHLDGRAGIRASVASTLYRRDGKVEVIANLSFGLVSRIDTTPSVLWGLS